MPNTGIMASSVNVAAGPCTDVRQEPFNNLSAWSGSGSIVTGRTATGVQTTSGLTYTIAAPSRSDTITVGFAIKFPTMTVDNHIVALYGDSGATMHVLLDFASGGSIYAWRGFNAAYLGNTIAGLVTLGAWAYVEVQTKMHDTTGFVTIRVNGTTVLTLANVDTKNGGTGTVFDTVLMNGGINAAILDDLYISTGSGCAFQGDHTIP